MLDLVIDARPASIAQGFDVRRILPYRLRRMLGPFIFMDHAGPVHATPEQLPSLDVLPHPHIGLSTVSYLFGGQATHRDSLGVEQIARRGELDDSRPRHRPLRAVRGLGRAHWRCPGDDSNLSGPARSRRGTGSRFRQLLTAGAAHFHR